jgi:hypothetical protein
MHNPRLAEDPVSEPSVRARRAATDLGMLFGRRKWVVGSTDMSRPPQVRADVRPVDGSNSGTVTTWVVRVAWTVYWSR